MKQLKEVISLGGSITKGEIESFTGKNVSILKPKIDQFCLIDIAKGLGYKAHFGGQTPFYFSIAQHCLLTEMLYVREVVNANPMKRMVALMHDASEAYMADMLKPYKVFLPKFIWFEKRMLKVIFEAFDLPFSMLKDIKLFDLMAQQTEKTCFNMDWNPDPMTPDESVEAFVNKFNEIKKEIDKLKLI